MELSSVVIPVHDSPGFNGAPAGDQGHDLLHTTPDQYSSAADHSSTTSSSASASPPLLGGSSGAATTGTVDGPLGRRAKALKSLNESIPHKMKLRNLQNSDWMYQKKSSWHKKSVRRLSKELYVIVSWYALLQSALFAAVAQTNIFKCEDWWGPVGIAAMVTMGTIKCALDKLWCIGEQQQQVLLFQGRQNAVFDKIEFLYLHGSACDLDTLEPESAADPSVRAGLLFLLSARGNLVLGFLLGFSALIMLSCIRMLCAAPCKCSSQ